MWFKCLPFPSAASWCWPQLMLALLCSVIESIVSPHSIAGWSAGHSALLQGGVYISWCQLCCSVFTCQPAIQLLSKLMVMINVEVLTSAALLCAQLLLPPPRPHPILPHSELMWMNDMKVLMLAVRLCAQLLSAYHSAPLQVDVGVNDQYESSNVSCTVVYSVVVAPPPPPPHSVLLRAEFDEQYESSDVNCAVVCSVVVGQPFCPVLMVSMKVLTSARTLLSCVLSCCWPPPRSWLEYLPASFATRRTSPCPTTSGLSTWMQTR